MLTGDKIETAKCIAIATGLLAKGQEIYEMVQLTTVKSVLQSIKEFKMYAGSRMLMVDGNSLAIICSEDDLVTEFFEVAKQAKTVCICRCSPKQKALVANNIKRITGKRIACVGDGGNDVAMI